MNSRTEFIEALVARGVAREAAVAEASRRFPAPPMPVDQVAQHESRLEHIEQNDIRKLVIALGGKVWSTSSVKKAKIAVGFPDLWLVVPALRLACWWETKSKTGTLRDEQDKFLRPAHDAGALVGAGTFADFHRFLHECLQVGCRDAIGDRRRIAEAMDLAGLTVDPTVSARERLPDYLAARSGAE